MSNAYPVLYDKIPPTPGTNQIAGFVEFRPLTSQKKDKHIYYPTATRRVQITPKTSTNITRYLYSRGLVRQVCLLLTNQLAGFPAMPILFHFAYFCHAFPMNKYPRNSPSRT